MVAVISIIIEIDENEVAWISGRRVKVIEIAIDKLAHDSTPEEMIEPILSVLHVESPCSKGFGATCNTLLCGSAEDSSAIAMYTLSSAKTR